MPLTRPRTVDQKIGPGSSTMATPSHDPQTFVGGDAILVIVIVDVDLIVDPRR